MKTQSKVIIGIGLLLILIISGTAITREQSSLPIFTSLDACEDELDVWKDAKGGFYTSCTSCSREFSPVPGYFSAWCFGSGSRGDQCISAGGECTDSTCSSCTDAKQICDEKESHFVNINNGDVVKIDNFGDVCDRIAFKVECDSGAILQGAEFSITSTVGLGHCEVSNTPPSSCTPRYDNKCDEDDGCGGVRDTDGQSCAADSFCAGTQCVNPCAGFVTEYCDGTAKLSEPRAEIGECVYDNIEINSLKCGYVPPTDEVPEENLPEESDAELPDAGDSETPPSQRSFLERHGLWIILGVIGLIVLLALGAFIQSERNKKTK